MAYMKNNNTIATPSVGWARVFSAIGIISKVLFTLVLVVVCLVLKGLAKLMKSR